MISFIGKHVLDHKATLEDKREGPLDAADSFRPDRWLVAKDQSREMERYSMAVSYASFPLQIMFLIAMVVGYGFEVLSWQKHYDAGDVEDCYICSKV
jgi:hypothetical protein